MSKLSKPFQTHQQQIKLLRSRGMEINQGNQTSKAMRFLERENYFSVINGYKLIFLEKDRLKGKPLTPEKFLVGTKFDEIASLYNFDRDLRNLLLNYMLKYESNLKSVISYRFSEEHANQSHPYLQLDNYRSGNRTEDTKTVLSTISTLSAIISRKGGKKGNAIYHYVDKHNHVPLWVLVKYLTFGNINFMYESLPDKIQNKIAKDFSSEYRRSYGLKSDRKFLVTKEMISEINKAINSYRNVAAHEEIMYKHVVTKTVGHKNIFNLFGMKTSDNDVTNVFVLIMMLRVALTKQDYKNLFKSLVNLFNDYQNELVTVPFSDVMKIMGFDDNWKQSLKA
ncbi:Abi family protein [Fructobacillus evanidus]|uniref:Abortive infection bacteriophage resistance protein (AbiF) n=2 Tax=Fructobacillus evanidus TaxID=3064281 RepID=A0ABM9MUK5_9LACO|nr:Abortive infection bacteriophage resistance protein (AbiF) [Fructobacillus sp. LMG 32999]CAK1237562.1 Abortive infection bacteriophage resistance protein (AbiF) [Fructobacillus sp. LMG 32999]CAK1241299.1 Abortive infection bacteriophage resistance protein (AbiF) [Fructobacillus sp. LMG 32999]CAK1245063.1 Abortive infection bacteriophage resistance protein (AbiF) [Fructobacillus sp. LMG 32999]CAK1246396.1 Abortive infection bacteriophage resistance protein (AbiF) [Fructobacillus sp. LMG 32999